MGSKVEPTKEIESAPKDDSVGRLESNAPDVIEVPDNIDDEEALEEPEEGGSSVMGTIFGREPAAISGFVSLLVKALILFNVIQMSPEQEIGLMAVVDAGLFLLVRQVVTPVAAPKLPLDTPVLVEGTGDEPPPDAVVAVKGPDVDRV